MGPRNKSEDDSVKWRAALGLADTFHPLRSGLMLADQGEHGIAEAALHNEAIISF
jgi:hypothetical protein